MKILYNGFYGFKNTGDDAFLEVCAWGAKEYWGTENNTFLGKNLPQLVNPSKSLPDYRIRIFNRFQTIALSRKADIFVSAGGSTFAKHNKYSLKSIALATRNIANRRMKMGAIGVSLGPFTNSENEKSVIDYLRNLDFLALRDERSFLLAQSFNLPYEPVKAFDLAALLPKVYRTKNISIGIKSSVVKIIGVSVCNVEAHTGGCLQVEAKRNNYLLEILSELAKNSNIILRFFVFNGHPTIGDEKLTYEITNKIGRDNIEVVPYLNNVKETWDKISECNFVLSTRLHASIFACYANIPFFLVEYHKKCSDFLVDVGQCEDYRIYDAEISPIKVVQMINDIVFENNYQAPLNKLETIELALNNFTKINIQ